MAFPQTPLPISVELQINGTWTDVSTDVRSQGGTEAITIQRGITSSGGMLADRSTCNLTLDNNSGNYSNRNPRSPYFGYLGRNIPLRVSVAHGTPWLDVSEGGTEHATTPDAAVLGVTGDIDIRADIEPAVWGDYRGGADSIDGPSYTEICGKWQNNPNRWSWMLLLSDLGQLVFLWSSDNSTYHFATSSSINLAPFTRQSVRVTLDVDNGAGGYTATFYTSATPGTAGPWAQLGATLTATPTTSLFNSTALLQIGDLSTVFYQPLAKKIYSVEVRNGIGGVIVANPDFTAQTVGATSFNDTAPSPRAWTATAAAVTNKYRRFTGEVGEWPPQWDTGGKDVTTPIQASGVLQRYNQSKTVLQSTLYRRLSTASDMVAYWPMEDSAGSTSAASPIAGVNPMRASGLNWAQDSTLAGSAPLPILSPPSSIAGSVPSSVLGDWQVEMVYKLDTLPAAPTLLFQVGCAGGTVAQVQFLVGVAVARIQALDSGGTVVATADFLPNNFTDGWGRLQIFTATSGGTVTLTAQWIVIGAPTNWFVQTAYTGTPGRVSGVSGGWDSSFQGLRIGHVGVRPRTTSSPYDNADRAFDGESAAGRLARVATEQGIALSVAAYASDTSTVGPQAQDTALNVLAGAAQADEGLLYEAREFLGLRYRGRVSLCSQPSAMDLPYSGSMLVAPLTPVEDLAGVINDSTVSRTGGSFGRSVITTGPLSVNPPPAGIGTGYDEAVTLDLHADWQTSYHAQWRTHVATWNEARFPQVNMLLQKNPSLVPTTMRIETGARMRITPPMPTWLPPDAIDLLVAGYTELLSQYNWSLQFACRPYGPFQVGLLEDPVLGRLDTDGSVLALAATSTATSLTVETTSGPYWTTSGADYPFDLRVSGEVVTATACVNAIIDSFTRTTSNGWGTTTSGQAWATSGGAPSDYSTNGTTGQMSLTSVNVARNAAAGPALADFDAEVSFSTPALAAGASQYVYLLSRYADANNCMLARVEFTTGQAVIISIRKRIAGTETQLSTTTTALTHFAGTLFRARFNGVGTAFQARVWAVSGGEQAVWDTAVVDSSVGAAGQVGVRAMLATGNTNTLPLAVTFDEFALLNPQTVTVVRGTNGLTKALPAGAAVSLANPLYLGL
jgi:hypothetical protein